MTYLADTVTLTGTQTLTNKTITSAAFSGTHTGAFTTTGNITIDSSTNAIANIDAGASTDNGTLNFKKAGVFDWSIQDVGTNRNLLLYRYVGGVFQDAPIAVANSTGNVTIANDLTVSGRVKTTATTVGGLPSAASAGAGARSFVTDANATTFASVVAGGGANGVPVYSDGTNWRIG